MSRYGSKKEARLAAIFPEAPSVRRMNYLINWSPKNMILYFETPKVACSSIKKMLQLAELNSDLNQLGENFHDKDSSPLQSPYDDIGAFEEAMSDPDYKRITFVRNPYTRTLSSFKDKVLNPENRQHRRLLRLGFSEQSDISFEAFLLAIRNQHHSQRDIHWLRQIDLTQIRQVQFDLIGRFENLRRDLSHLRKVLRLESVDMDIFNQAPHATYADASVATHFNENCKALVDEIYHEDFLAFGYPKSLKFI
jgi:Sulfotransferase family